MTMPIKGSRDPLPDQQGYREEPDDVQCRDANRNRSMLSIVSACVLIGMASMSLIHLVPSQQATNQGIGRIDDENA